MAWSMVPGTEMSTANVSAWTSGWDFLSFAAVVSRPVEFLSTRTIRVQPFWAKAFATAKPMPTIVS